MEGKTDGFRIKPSNYATTSVHRRRQISAALESDKLRSFEGWNQTEIIVHSTSHHSRTWRSDRKLWDRNWLSLESSIVKLEAKQRCSFMAKDSKSSSPPVSTVTSAVSAL